MINRLLVAILACMSLCGCVRVMKAGYPARTVTLNVSHSPASDISVRVGPSGTVLFPNSEGVVEIELPEIPSRCDTYLLYPHIPLQRNRVPYLYVLKADRVLGRTSIGKVHRDAEILDLPLSIPVE